MRLKQKLHFSTLDMYVYFALFRFYILFIPYNIVHNSGTGVRIRYAGESMAHLNNKLCQ